VHCSIFNVDDCKLIERQFTMFNISFKQTSMTITSNLTNCKINPFASRFLQLSLNVLRNFKILPKWVLKNCILLYFGTHLVSQCCGILKLASWKKAWWPRVDTDWNAKIAFNKPIISPTSWTFRVTLTRTRFGLWAWIFC